MIDDDDFPDVTDAREPELPDSDYPDTTPMEAL